MTLKKFVPDTAKEWHLIGRYILHLGSLISASLVFNSQPGWVFVSIILTWVGTSVADYFGHQNGGEEKKPE